MKNQELNLLFLMNGFGKKLVKHIVLLPRIGSEEAKNAKFPPLSKCFLQAFAQMDMWN